MNEEGMKRGVNYSNDGNGTGVRCIEHKVSKFDTLAGIAIKYGVEVEDIKRMNCLMTDIQMFAHEQMKIPIPGRHPPSENLPNGSSHKNRIKDPSYRGHSHIDLLESFQSLKLKSTRPKVMSPAMANLQCYYGLSSSETTVSRTNIKPDLQQQPYGNHRKTRSVNGYTSENEEITEDSIVADGEDNSILDKCYCENSVRRRQKADVEPSYNTSGVLSRRKDEGYSSSFSLSSLSPISTPTAETGKKGKEEQKYLLLLPTSLSRACFLDPMDADLWASRLAAAKRQYSLQQQNQNSQLDRLSMDDYEMEEEMRLEFPCPYCHEEYDITALCVHLEDEHPFESKVIICSICSAKVNRDLLNHITTQHRHLFKMPSRRRRLRRVSIPNGQAFSLMGRDLREAHLQALLASSGLRPCFDDPPPAAVPDSLLSSLVLNYPTPEADVPKPTTVSTPDDTAVPSKTWKSGLDPSLTYEEREQKLKQAAVIATFVQSLLLSTLFGD